MAPLAADSALQDPLDTSPPPPVLEETGTAIPACGTGTSSHEHFD
jgi:hypothetical protein